MAQSALTTETQSHGDGVSKLFFFEQGEDFSDLLDCFPLPFKSDESLQQVTAQLNLTLLQPAIAQP